VDDLHLVVPTTDVDRMCRAPTWIYHPDGVEYGKLAVPCRKCWECQKLRKDDYVGRLLAEQAFSDWTAVLTLTYRDSPERELDGAHLEVYPLHLQKFVRSLRRRGLLVRYFATAEKGSRFGRAHFHMVLFGKGPKPDWPDGRKVRHHVPEWPHGFISSEFNPEARAFRYVAKYILKDGGWFTLSKKPPLGAEFFAEKAERDFRYGLLPWSWSYRPPGAVDGHRYIMSGASRRDYLVRLAELAGLCITELPDRGNDWVRMACFKIDETWKRRRQENMPLDEAMEIIAAILEQKRPKFARIVLDPDFEEPLYVDGNGREVF